MKRQFILACGVLVALAGSVRANDDVTVRVSGPAGESLWRSGNSSPWQSTTSTQFTHSLALLGDSRSFDLRPGGAAWYSTHALDETVEKNYLLDIFVGQVVGGSQAFNYGAGEFTLPTFATASSVPEPAAAVLGLLGVGGLGLLRRRA